MFLPVAFRTSPGMLLSLLAMLMFAASDVFAKLLSDAFHPIQIAWFRYAVAVVLVVPMVARTPRILVSRQPLAQIMRGASLLLATLFLIAALGMLPIADATVLVFMSPFLVLILSGLFLGERVPPSSWIAVAAGNAGMLIAIRPGFSNLTIAAMLPLCSSLAWSVGVILTRTTNSRDSLLTTVTYSALVGFALSSVAVAFIFVPMDWLDVAMALGMGLLWGLAHLCVAVAYRSSPAAALAPFSYTQIIWATMFGYLIYSTLPDTATLVGCVLIVGGGLYAAARRPAPQG